MDKNQEESKIKLTAEQQRMYRIFMKKCFRDIKSDISFSRTSISSLLLEITPIPFKTYYMDQTIHKFCHNIFDTYIQINDSLKIDKTKLTLYEKKELRNKISEEMKYDCYDNIEVFMKYRSGLDSRLSYDYERYRRTCRSLIFQLQSELQSN